jgi:thymidine kinase
MNQGYLKVILGCMYAGKTSKIIQIYKMMQFSNIPTTVINYEEDDRYHEEFLSTHDKIMIPCIKTKELMKIIPIENDVIIINEGQFFPDLYDFVIYNLKLNKKIYVCGLDGDFKMEKFGQMLDIIPLSNEVEKLSAICAICKNGEKAYFTKRISHENEQKIIGSDNYLPVCRSCH